MDPRLHGKWMYGSKISSSILTCSDQLSFDVMSPVFVWANRLHSVKCIGKRGFFYLAMWAYYFGIGGLIKQIVVGLAGRIWESIRLYLVGEFRSNVFLGLLFFHTFRATIFDWECVWAFLNFDMCWLVRIIIFGDLYVLGYFCLK